MTNRMRVGIFALILLVALTGRGEYVGTPPDRNDPAIENEDFITTSLLTLGESRTIYSRFGHTLFRIRTKTGRDVCFSYEGENVSANILRYLTGRLKMGMFAVPTPVFIAQYQKVDRPIRENVLNLSPAARYRLWVALDKRAHEGIALPYDYLTRGCAKTAFEMIVDAASDELTLPELSAKYDRTIREIVEDALRDVPWAALWLSGMTGTDVDADLPRKEKLILPQDLIETLSWATCRGKPALGPTVVLFAGSASVPSQGGPHPIWIAFAFLVLVCVFRSRLGLIVPIIQAIPGVFLIYLVFLSTVPSTGWNWLLIPFNPLPLCFWKMRKHKAYGRAIGLTLLAWVAYMIFSPLRLTLPTYLILAIAFSIYYLTPIIPPQRGRRLRTSRFPCGM